MAFCKHCGNQIEDNATFCGVCGQSQNETQAQAPVYQAPVYQAPVQQPVYVAPQVPMAPYGQAMIPAKGMGVASMVLGILSLVMFCVWYLAIPCAIIGAALGGVAQSRAKLAGTRNGMAAAGITCSCIALGIAVLFMMLAILEVVYLDDLFYYFY